MSAYITEWQHTVIPSFEVRPYQQSCYQAIVDHMRQEWVNASKSKLYLPKPIVADLTVGAGKSLIIAMLAKHFTDKGLQFLCLARAAELVQQNFDESWSIGCKASAYSASLKSKSRRYKAIYATEGTVARAIVPNGDFGVNSDTQKPNWLPDVIAIDECFIGSTLITTSNGYKRIDEVTKHDFIKCIDHDTGMVHFHNPTKIKCTGVKKISKVTTDSGVLICTSNHPLYLIDYQQYREVISLSVGDRIALDGSNDSVLIKLQRALVAVAKKLFRTLTSR